MKRNAAIKSGLDFNDVLLVPRETQVKPAAVKTATRVTRDLRLSIPLLSAGVDSVTESEMAIILAQLGGLGVIHCGMSLGKQVEEVRRVKRAESTVVLEPITISPDSSVAEAIDLMKSYRVSGLPVVEQPSRKLVGIITHRDVRFFEDYAKPVSDLMTKKVITVKGKVTSDVARQMMHQYRIEKLVVVDDQERCTGLITVKDLEKMNDYPQATRDKHGRLCVGAAVGAGKEAVDRANAMADAGLDVVFVDVAHAHNREVVGTVSMIRQQRSSVVQVVAGNVATADGARSLIDAGADAIKVGIGGVTESATRSGAGVGVPQLSAILEISEVCQIAGIPLLIDGGIRDGATLAKAIAAGADAAVISDIFAGTDQAPGQVLYHAGQAYKMVNPPHHPTAAMAAQDAYRIEEDMVDTSVPYRGSVVHIVGQLIAGLKTAMAYSGGGDIETFKDVAEFTRLR
jgi:IMP dehydrogenase